MRAEFSDDLLSQLKLLETAGPNSSSSYAASSAGPKIDAILAMLVWKFLWLKSKVFSWEFTRVFCGCNWVVFFKMPCSKGHPEEEKLVASTKRSQLKREADNRVFMVGAIFSS